MDDKLKELLKRITELLRPLGYKKDALNYRFYGEDGLCKIVNIQRNRYNTKESLKFVINYGIYFEQETSIKNRKFKEYDCIIRNRIYNGSAWWLIDESTDIDQLFCSVRKEMDQIFDMFHVFADKQTAINMILEETANCYSPHHIIMHYHTAKLLAEMGYSDRVYRLIKDAKAQCLMELAEQIKSQI